MNFFFLLYNLKGTFKGKKQRRTQSFIAKSEYLNVEKSTLD